MDLNADFDIRAVVHGAIMPWQQSPMAGVERRMLDRIGDEVARATTIVRYAPKSHFSAHVHSGGEEFFVLDGVFQDEHGDYPAGSYVRNPPQSSHTPGSEHGCTIFVKLWQFDPEDRNPVRLDTNAMIFDADPARPGVEVMGLFRDDLEQVSLEKWLPGSKIELASPAGLEVLVLEGGFEEGDEKFETQSWLRLPKGSTSHAIAGPKGVKLWIKRNHLARAPKAPAQ